MPYVIPLKSQEEQLLSEFAKDFLKPHQDIWILRWNTLAAAHIKIPKNQKQLLHLPDSFIPFVLNSLILKRHNTIYRRYAYLGWQVSHAGLSYETALSLIGFQMIGLLQIVEEVNGKKIRRGKALANFSMQQALTAFSKFQHNCRQSFLQGYFQVRETETGQEKEELRETLQISKVREKEERFLREILRGTSQYLNFDELFRVFSSSLREIGNYDRVSVLLKSENPDEIELLAVSVAEPTVIQRGVFRDPHNPAVSVIQEGKPRIISDFSKETQSSVLAQLYKEGIQSAVVVPLIAGREALGALSIASKNKSFFQESELSFFQKLASGLAVSVRNSTEYSKLQEHLEFQKCAAGVIAKIRASLERAEVMNAVCREIAHCSHADRVYFGEAVEPAGLCRIEEEYLNPDSSLKEIPSAKGIYQLADFQEAVEILRKGEIIAAPTEGDVHPALRRPQKILLELKVKTTCWVPIFVLDKYWGVLGIQHCSAAYRWKKTELLMLKDIAREIGKSLEHCQIYEKEKEKVTRLENMLKSKEV